METTETIWQRVRGLPDGHRLFKLKDRPEMIAIADDSGETPDQTDDGVLWLDRHRPLIAPATDFVTGSSGCIIPLLDANGAKSTTVTDFQTLLMLAADYGWEVIGAYGLRYTVNPPPKIRL